MALIIKILGFLYKMLTTRMLGLEGMRLISMIMPSLALCLSLSSLSLQSVCNQNIASNINKKTTSITVIILSCLKITLSSSSIISILMLLSFPIYKYLYADSFIYYPLLSCIPLLFFSNISGVLKGYLEANDQFKITYLSNIIESLSKLASTVIILYLFKNASINIKIIIVFSSLTFSELSSNIYLSYKVKRGRKIKIIKTNNYERKVLKQAIPLTLSTLVNTVVGYINPFIFYYAAKINGFNIIQSTTYYTLISSYAIPLIISGEAGIQTIAKITFPKITKTINNNYRLSKTINDTLVAAMVISFISFSLFQFQTNFLLNIMYGDDLSAPIVRVLSYAYLFSFFDPIFIIILQSLKKEKTIFIITLASQSITMLLTFILTGFSNLYMFGIVIAIISGMLLKFILLAFSSLKVSSFRPNIKLLNFLLLSIIFILALYINKSLFGYIIILLIYCFLLFPLYRYCNKLIDHQKKRHI